MPTLLLGAQATPRAPPAPPALRIDASRPRMLRTGHPSPPTPGARRQGFVEGSDSRWIRGGGMGWQARLRQAVEAVGGLQVPPWLAPTSTFVSVVLLLALLTVAIHNLRLRRELAGRSGDAAAASPTVSQDGLQTVSLEGEGQALIDRWLPRRPRSFVLAVVLLAAACWALGLVLATDARAFLASREWQIQPLYLAVHLVTLRLFATAFVRSFLAGVTHLDITDAAARHRMWLVLGPIGAVVAAALAAPFCVFDYGVL